MLCLFFLHRLPLVWLRFLPRLDCRHWPEHSWRCEHPCWRYPPWPGYEPGLKSQMATNRLHL